MTTSRPPSDRSARSSSSTVVGGWAVGLLMALLPLAGNAQVIRCSDPVTGKVTYTDGRCASGTKAQEIEPRKTPEEIQEEREQAALALERKREKMKLEAEQRQQQQQDRQLSANERSGRGRSEEPNPANSQACLQARRNFEEVQSTMGRGMYDEAARLDAAQRQLDQACLTQEQWVQAQRDRERSGAYAPAYPYVVQPPFVIRPPYPSRPSFPSRPPERPQPQPRPPEMTNCNVFRCTDAAGNVYPR